MGLVHTIRDPHPAAWIIDQDTGSAVRTEPIAPRAQIETCARCHSRRVQIWDEYEHGRPLLDTHRPSLLSDPLYHADGQILDEVYVYGSFLQSKMHQKGVTCADCHEPHSLELRLPGNALCYRCHLPSRFDTPEHHHHRPGSAGGWQFQWRLPARQQRIWNFRCTDTSVVQTHERCPCR
jgi:hypothetical protein